MIDFEKAEQDIEWIESALTAPSYLLTKRDKGNMFELNDDGEGYVRYVIGELERKGYKVRRVGYFISVEQKGVFPSIFNLTLKKKPRYTGKIIKESSFQVL